MTRTEFIEKIGPKAEEDMKKTGILASLTIAQGVLESGNGSSTLATVANNLFGIKGSYKGASYTVKTKEFVNGEWITISAAFRRYPSWAESIADHSALLLGNRYKKLHGCTDYKAACRYVHEAGYATAPNYAAVLVNLIEVNKLTRFDCGVAVKPPQSGPSAPAGVAVGDRVQFKGGPVYTSANAASAAKNKGASVCKVTRVYTGAHPLHCISEDGGGVCGWVDAENVAQFAPTMRAGARVEYSGPLYVDSNGSRAGTTVKGSYTVSRLLPGKKCGILLNGGLGWVPESACKVIE